MRLSAQYVDTCLPCYLQDGYNRPGERLLYTCLMGQTVEEAARELLDTFQPEPELDGWIEPDELSARARLDEQIIEVLEAALEGVDLRPVDESGNRVDLEGAADDWEYPEGDEPPNVYVVLRWEVS